LIRRLRERGNSDTMTMNKVMKRNSWRNKRKDMSTKKFIMERDRAIRMMRVRRSWKMRPNKRLLVSSTWRSLRRSGE
jgi:hypothetical protein